MAIAAEPIDAGEHRFSVTVSMGVAQLSLGLSNLAALPDAADAALYQAKTAGRHRVCLWEPVY